MSRMPSCGADLPVRHPLVLAVAVGVVADDPQDRVVGLARRRRAPRRWAGWGCAAAGSRSSLVDAVGLGGELLPPRRRGPGSRPGAASASSALPSRRSRPTCFDSSLTRRRTSSRSAVELALPARRARRPGRPGRGSDARGAPGRLRRRRGRCGAAGRRARARPTVAGRPAIRLAARAVSAAGSVADRGCGRGRATSSSATATSSPSTACRFAAEAGAVTALLGPNGAGKTTTVEALEGYRRADAGAVRVLGLDPVADHAALTRRIGVMLQDGRRLPRHPAARGAPPVLRLYGRRRRPRRAARRGRARRRGPGDLAAAVRRRAAAAVAALALVGGPRSCSSTSRPPVDVAGRQQLRAVIRSLRDAGCCVLVTTHDLDEAEKLADRVVIIDRGRVVADGHAGRAALAGLDRRDPLRRPAGARRRRRWARPSARRSRRRRPASTWSHGAPTPANVAALTAWLAEHDLPLADLRAGRQRLEDVFLRLTAPHRAAAPLTARP